MIFSQIPSLFMFYHIFYNHLPIYLGSEPFEGEPNVPLFREYYMILPCLEILQCVLPKIEDIVLQDHRTGVKARKLALIRHSYLICRPYSDFTNHLSNVLIAKGSPG